MSVSSLLSSKSKSKSKFRAKANDSANSQSLTARPSVLWWLIGLVLLCLCVLMQMPASWVVQKFLGDDDHIQWVSGNLWQGSLSWQMPMQGKPPLVGSVDWQWQPSQLLLARLGADVQVVSGGTRLQGKVARGIGKWRMVDMNGRIGADTLQTLVAWQVPNAPIEVKQVSLVYDKQMGFNKADGMMSWVGGELSYPSGGRVFEMTLPAMTAQLTSKKTKTDNVANTTATNGKQHALHLQLLDEDSKRLGELLIDANAMVDVSLTQRLLEHVPDYQGSAPKDSVVVAVRQPLILGVSSHTHNPDAHNPDAHNLDAHSPDTHNFDAPPVEQGEGL